MFAFTGKACPLSPYIPSKGKTVILLSTEYRDNAAPQESTNIIPYIILHCNQIRQKGAADTVDKE